MEKYHITITDNETGATKVDLNTDALIAAIDETAGGTHAVCYTDCGPAELAAALATVMQLANSCLPDLPRPIRRKVKQLSKKKKNFN